MAQKCIYPNLSAELARRQMTQRLLGDGINIDESTVSLKLTGKRDITLGEAKRIKEFLNVKMPLDELFAITADIIN